MNGAGVLATHQNEYARAEGLHRDGLVPARELGDRSTIAACLHNVGWNAIRRHEFSEAQALLEEAVSVARAAGIEVAKWSR